MFAGGDASLAATVFVEIGHASLLTQLRHGKDKGNIDGSYVSQRDAD